MQLKFKRLDDKAILPIRAHKSDAGLDLTCTHIDTTLNEANQLMIRYHTDLAVEIPEGYVGLLMARSSIWKKSITLTNCVGVIDSGYRGEIMAIMHSTTDTVPALYKEGERFAQLVIVPIPELEVVEEAELSESDRGTDGFGSTGTTNNTVDNTTDKDNERSAKDTKEETSETVTQRTSGEDKDVFENN